MALELFNYLTWAKHFFFLNEANNYLLTNQIIFSEIYRILRGVEKAENKLKGKRVTNSHAGNLGFQLTMKKPSMCKPMSQ